MTLAAVLVAALAVGGAASPAAAEDSPIAPVVEQEQAVEAPTPTSSVTEVPADGRVTPMPEPTMSTTPDAPQQPVAPASGPAALLPAGPASTEPAAVPREATATPPTVPAATSPRPPGLEGVPDFPVERTATVVLADGDVLRPGSGLRVGGGGVSADAEPAPGLRRPTWAWRWSDTAAWTYGGFVTAKSSGQNPVALVPEVPVGSPATELSLEVVVVYSAEPSQDLPEKFLHYWKSPKAYLVGPAVPQEPEPEPQAPKVVQGIQDATVRVGEPATFTFEASGYPLPRATYAMLQMREMKVPVGSNSALLAAEHPELVNVGAGIVTVSKTQSRFEYRIAKTTPEMDGLTVEFFGEGFDPRGWAYNGPVGKAKLAVLYDQEPAEWAAPTVTRSPVDAIVEPDTEGSRVILTSAATGSPAPGVQWQRKRPGGDWEDAQTTVGFNTFNPELWLTVGESDSGMQWRAKWSNRKGDAFSQPATILVRGTLPEGSYWGDSDPKIEYSVPAGAEAGRSITVSGKRWLTPSARSTGSLVTVRFDGAEAADVVRHPVTNEVLTDRSIHAAVKANSAGAWSATIPLPAAWKPGERHRVTIGSGQLAEGDKARTESHEFDVWAAAEQATIVQGLPARLPLRLDGNPTTFRVQATAPTPIAYRWQYRPVSGEWMDVPANHVFSAQGDTLTVLPMADGENFFGLEGTRVRVSLTTRIGTVHTTESTLGIEGNATLSYDSSRDYAVGSMVPVTGAGYSPGQPVTVRLGASRVDVDAGPNGRISTEIAVPGVARDPLRPIVPGGYRIVALAGAGHDVTGAVGPELQIVADTSIAAPTAVEPLPAVSEIAEGAFYTLAPRVSGEDLKYLWFTRSPAPGGGQGYNDSSTYSGEASLRFDDERAFTVVVYNAAGSVTLQTQLDVIPADGSPSFRHVTANADDAVAWIEQAAESGGTVRIRGKGWTSHTPGTGSTIAVKLNYRHITDETGQYERTGDAILKHPISGSDDATIWAIVRAGNDGAFSTTIDLPAGLQAGQRLTVSLASGVFAENDVQRTVVSPSLLVGGMTWEEPPVEVVVCTPSTSNPEYTVAATPAADGTLRVTGTGWCNPRNGGSVIAIKIDDGKFSHVSDDVHSNRTVWAIVTADDETGDWEADLRLPDGTTAGPNGSSPAFGDGEHWIRLLTGSLKDYDPIRTIGTPMGRNTSFVVGEYKPTRVPNPLQYDEQLTDTSRGGVSAEKTETDIVVTVPGAKHGDWIHLSAYVADGSPRLPWGGMWFRADARGRVTAPLGGVTLPVGDLKLVAQSGNQGELGKLLGWMPLSVEAPKTDTPPVKVAAPEAGPAPTGSVPSALPGTSGVPRFALAARAAASSAPNIVPAAPFPDDTGLMPANAGTPRGVQDGTVVTVTLPDSAPGDWVYLYAYSKPIPVGWIQVDAERQIRVDIGSLPRGDHKLALLNASGALIGWVGGSVTAGRPASAAAPGAGAGESGDTLIAAPQTGSPIPVSGLSATDWWLLGGGATAAGLVLLAVLLLRQRRKTITEGHTS